jgi:hypothetical protein
MKINNSKLALALRFTRCFAFVYILLNGSRAAAQDHKTSQPVAQKPTLQQTLAWLNGKFSTEPVHYVLPESQTEFVVDRSIHFDEIKGCRLTVVETEKQRARSTITGAETVRRDFVMRTPIDLSQLRPENIEVATVMQGQNIVTNFWRVTVHLQNPGKPLVRTDEGSGDVDNMDALMLDLAYPGSSPDIGKRVATAMKAAIEKCGGKPVKELY